MALTSSRDRAGSDNMTGSRELPDIGALLREYAGMLFRIASGYTRTLAARDDLAQEMSVAVWKGLPAYRGEGALKAFVARTAQFTALDHVRKRSNRFDDVTIDEAFESPDPQSDEHAGRSQGRQQLLMAARALPAGQRECVLLVLEGFNSRWVIPPNDFSQRGDDEQANHLQYFHRINVLSSGVALNTGPSTESVLFHTKPRTDCS